MVSTAQNNSSHVRNRIIDLTKAFLFKSYAKKLLTIRAASVPRRFGGSKMEFVIAIEVLVGLVFIVTIGSNVLELELSRRSYRCLSNPVEDTESEE